MLLSKYNIFFKIKKKDKYEYVLLNGLTGSLDLISRDLKKVLDGNNIVDEEILEKNLINNLKIRGYIYDEKNEEEEIIKTIFKMYNENSYKLLNQYAIIPTYLCNLNCPYCFQRNYDRINKKMDNYEINKIFEVINEIEKNKKSKIDYKDKPRISILGGEVFLNDKKSYQSIKNILDKCNENKYNIQITTNGVNLINYVNLLINYKTLNYVQVTLDGPKEIHDKRRIFPNGDGTFNLISKGIEEALSNDINIVTRINLDKENLVYLNELINYFFKKKWLNKDNFAPYLSPVTDNLCLGYDKYSEESDILNDILHNENIDNMLNVLNLNNFRGFKYMKEKFIEQKEMLPIFYRCEANLNQLIFDVHGDLYTCLEACGNPEYSVGRYIPSFEIFQEKLKNWRKRSVLSITDCKECAYQFICAGGCTWAAVNKTGCFLAPECQSIRKEIEISLNYFLNKYDTFPNF